MGRCIICDAEVEGADICAFHEEDVLFTFRGDSPHELVEGRYYLGEVDGLADFGVFVDLGNGVTGLLHRNQLDRRLESLGWEPGDEVCVQVTTVHEDGQVDLGPSIRQSPEEFRGALEQATGEGPAPEPAGRDRPSQPDQSVVSRDLERVQIRSLDGYFGREVLLEGIIEEIRQTGGPTVIALKDESGTVECAAFAGAGVRAYPDLEVGDVVRIRGSVERRFGDLQIEVENVERLVGEADDEVTQRVADGELLPPTIDTLSLLYDDAANLAIEPDIREAAAEIRRAIELDHPVRIRHPVTVDGFVAGVALERAVEAVAADPSRPRERFGVVDRRPVRDPPFGLDAAIDDVLKADPEMDRPPFVILVGLGSTDDERPAYDLLETYGIDYYVIDTASPDPTVLDRVDPFVNPWCGDGTFPIPPTTAVAVNVAGLVAEDARDDLHHLPAVSARDPPGTARRLLEESPYDRDDVRTMRQAVSLEAYYQPGRPKRALMHEILFEHRAGAVQPFSDQFQEKLDRAVETAVHNATVHRLDGHAVAVLDVDRFGNRFEFPPVPVLLEGLLEATGLEATVAVGIGADFVEVVAEADVDLTALADGLAEAVPDGALAVRGGPDGRVRFLAGRRDDVSAAAVDAVTRALRA
ncbi:MAG: OB-fold nucleic acid binding domain-containing protein [Halobacteriales archaeon]